ncbi:MAG: prepilin-type N-terminal cleavage/methylation domain-containing protein [Planctomycetota bacterium]|jgi:prepilin-type N-terminal cleavage/methylation domain-containing protein
MTCRPTTNRAFTLLELLVVMTVAAVVAVLLLPTAGDEDRLRLIGASAVVRSDLEYAQVLTIASPDDPIVMRFDVPNATYWLARSATPGTPITRPDTGVPYQVVLGQGRARTAVGVTLELADVPADTLAFNPLGGLADPTLLPAITLRAGPSWVRLDIAPTTGTVTETASQDDGGGGESGGGGSGGKGGPA